MVSKIPHTNSQFRAGLEALPQDTKMRLKLFTKSVAGCYELVRDSNLGVAREAQSAGGFCLTGSRAPAPAPARLGPAGRGQGLHFPAPPAARRRSAAGAAGGRVRRTRRGPRLRTGRGRQPPAPHGLWLRIPLRCLPRAGPRGRWGAGVVVGAVRWEMEGGSEALGLRGRVGMGGCVWPMVRLGALTGAPCPAQAAGTPGRHGGL